MAEKKKGERISHLLSKAKQTDPKQTFTHDSAPTNLEYGSRGLLTKTVSKKHKTFRYKIL